MPRLFLSALALAALLPRPTTAFDLSGDRWTTSPVRIELQLGPTSGTLIDGSASWNVVANDALSAWNNSLVSFRFSGVLDSTAAQGRSNRINNVFFSSTIYGDSWGGRTLAIIEFPTSWRRARTRLLCVNLLVRMQETQTRSDVSSRKVCES